MSNTESTLKPEKREDQSSDKKTYIRPMIAEEVALPTASANGIVLTPVVWD